MIQKEQDINKWHELEDPWGYKDNRHDIKRKNILLSEIPHRNYKNVLDIGCGQGFITQDLPGKNVIGVDISKNAIGFAKKKEHESLSFKQGSIFEIDQILDIKFDLIIITGVLYSQYIGESTSLIYLLIDKLLNKNGILISVHINEWYYAHFPYLKTKQLFYPYREYNHKLEMYIK